MKVKGKIKPLRDNILISDMDFGSETTRTGIILNSDDGKSTGIRPRWGKVFAIGPEQKEIDIGDWVLVEHGRWTRTINYELDDGKELELRMIDNKAILMVSDDKPAQ
jgi:co-chaperonin GroES (HSP10)